MATSSKVSQGKANHAYLAEAHFAEQLVKELRDPIKAQALGDAAYQLAKKDLAKCPDRKSS